MANSNCLNFEDLNLSIGQIIQIHPSPNSKERFDCMLVGCLPGEAVMITAPPSGEFPVVEEGQQVAIRVMSSNGVALFPTTVLFVGDVPVFMVYLDFPRAIQFKLVRNATRVDVALPILVSNKTREGIRGIVGKITDISTTGARINLFDDVGEAGELIELKGKFEVGEIRRMVNVEAIIRSKPVITGEVVTYGVEFHEADEEKLIVLFGFIFSAIAYGKSQIVR